ncbi:MAG: hypothetical protein JEY91_08295 [Spirochaetaceae bacterium]|nr:hypothetical protein [Spirochaetaceae bacterium]
MKRILSVIVVFLSLSVSLHCHEHISFMLEFDQILSLRAGIEFISDSNWGLKTSGGFGIPNIKSLKANFLIFYRLCRPDSRWYFDLEAGCPLAYADFWENKYVDWDPIITSPYAGWLVGLSLMIRYSPWGLGLRLGAGAWWEWQEYNGMKGPRIMPIVALTYVFNKKKP